MLIRFAPAHSVNKIFIYIIRRAKFFGMGSALTRR